ncbi:hypothetical protein [Flavobacterium tructae]|uniref:Uncharacterized protein n=1 Tax=Flavobacterium tructae TaxID=1114873 RepID=A0A1S1J1X3_9FLAO|nr:hypothetical protein [Flavobacterium tructae]OHT43760.1 hypothetical protein BHE19_15520 [Flavobacterium tructae]OXB20529.1 hypothetical protein B0A71_06910 [Flavobacterium tructae]
MFTNISWGSYLTAAGIAIIFWYLIILLKFHRSDFKKILSGEKKLQIPFLKKTSKNLQDIKSISDSFPKSFDTLEDAENLSQRIKEAVKESAEKRLTKEQFQNYLRMLLDEYPYVKISSLRENINQQMVFESQKHPNLLLTLSEADSLWEGSVF